MFRAAILVISIALVTDAEKNNCKCWSGFEVTINPFGNIYCQDKINRTFNCNEPEPPVCKCTLKGDTVVLDLGESNCQSVDPNSGSWCDNREEWVSYFERHPEYMMIS